MTDAEVTVEQQGRKTTLRGYLLTHLREYGLLFALIAIMLFFQLVTDGTLLKSVNIVLSLRC